MPTTPPTAAELAAELAVRDAYDRARGRRPFDMAGSRREVALRRLAERARKAAQREGYAAPSAVDVVRPDLERAYRRLAGGLIRRWTTDAVVAALVDVGDELELPRPAILDRVLNGDGRYTVHAAGGSRGRRR